MQNRTAKVDSIKITSALLASVIQIGDSKVINSFSRIIAIQRQIELFYADEANFDAFEVFSRSLPVAPITDPITIRSRSINPLIKVGNINVIGLSAGAVVHIGSFEHAQMESRILHIRQIQQRGENTDKEE